MNLSEYLSANHKVVGEGYSQQVPEQVADLIEITKGRRINMMEIGFNAGHSAEIFLRNNPDLLLTSFDLGLYDYTETSKDFIDTMYPGRHTLILGDSTETVPKMPDTKFDIIFIDGGHEYHIAAADMANCRRFSHKDTLVLLDDTVFKPEWTAHWTLGPTKVWTEWVNQGKIQELQRKDYMEGRGMSWGYYLS
jgi:predicted O-methyltransferase YrrM